MITLELIRVVVIAIKKVRITKTRPVAPLVEHRAAMQEVERSTPAGPTLGVLK